MHNLTNFAAVALLSFSSCAALGQEFLVWEGKNAIQEGEGGTKKTIDGIDFWADGAPPRKFRLIGYIHDKRHATGIVGKIRMSGLESDIAKTAKTAGGDAVILVDSNDQTVGTVAAANTSYARSNATSVGFAHSVRKHESRYAVVKYLSDPPAAPAAASPAAPAQ